MHSSRQRILDILKERGATTVEQLSQDLGLTTVTVRHHLDILRSEGLVGDPQIHHRATPGRPQYSYALTSRASEVFPTNYANLARQLLEEVKARASQDDLLVIFQGVSARMMASAPLPRPGEPVEARVVRAVEFLNGQGYLSHFERVSNGYLLHTCNCPYRDISSAHQELCGMDLSLVTSLLGGEVECRGRVKEGQNSCSFFVPDLSGEPEFSVS